MPLDPTGVGPFVISIRANGDVALSLFLDQGRDFSYFGPDEQGNYEPPRHRGTLVASDCKYLQHRFRAVIEAIVKAEVTKALAEQGCL